ncbi:Mn2+ homeostasis protein [Lasiodiplodia theobromae]|uniref:Mn2+ homeostasis protein n=1 Tax=Lasiodiplodia theobromae TaxID=45133 RepID=UPI0015C368A8|nr:Mn2+ homeostasis protein [Lasiodiplodia theobromae]KAF4546645.1 Mn2+ homeostasis protein [Lasiodiplodia theobromae]
MDHHESAAHELLAMSQEERLHPAARPRLPSQESASDHSAGKSDRDKYQSPNPPSSSITPPPSSQVPPAPPSRTSIRTPTPPTPVLSSPPPTSRPGTQVGAPALSFTLEQINGAAPEELRDIAAELMVALRESRTSAAHHKLQYNMLCMDSVEAQNRMAVELAMAQREVEVLQQAEERRRNDIASPHQSMQQTVSPANAALLNEMSRHIQILQNENEELRDMLDHSKRVTERREGEIAGLVEENERLRGRIRKNRDHLNGILGDVYDTDHRSSLAQWLFLVLRQATALRKKLRASSNENVINESDKDTEIDESQASQMASIMRVATPGAPWLLSAALVALLLLAGTAHASLGDRLPDFKDCVKVCTESNCEGPDQPPIPFRHRLLLWDCPSECDYTCQHIVTDKRLARDPPYRSPVLQFHGKWPFHRFMGMQEPFSVLFSLLNYLAHAWGISTVRARIPETYPLRRYYIVFGYFGLNAWTWSMVFHTRDFSFTEKMDYFGAGASVLYGLYYTPIRIWRWDRSDPPYPSVRRAWTALCLLLYAAHVAYLTLWRWDYTYNMAANVAVGIVHNLMWSWFAIERYRRLKRTWAAWPGLIVAWIIMAMSLELLDFPPWKGMIDAHSLWHLGTVLPTVWWYMFLIRDAEEDLQGARLKA